ncbi:MAG TPA: ATP-binding protein [Polyangiales bacterium]|nr:ATP-binding protein [Polyangiales bacterium]
MATVERGEHALRRLHMLAALSRATTDLHDRAVYCLRARDLLASYTRDFRFVELYPLERDAAVSQSARWPLAAVGREPQVVQDEGEPVWLASLHAAYDETAFAVLALGLGEGWGDDQPVLQLLTRQLEQGLLDARLAHERAQDELTRTLFQLSPVAICVTGGPEHRYLLANRSYKQMVNKEDLVGHTVTEVWPEIIDSPLLAVFDRVYTTGEPYVTEEFATYLDRDGDGIAEECFFRFNLVATRDPAGHITGWTCTAAEITGAVRARREAQHARALAEQANRAKDEFLAMLGHELRNPLAPITTSLYLMEKQGGERFASERAIIQRQVDHLVRLVDDLLDVARVTGGKVRLQKRALELSTVVREAVEQVSSVLRERAQRLSVYVPERGLMVHGDLERLAQVVSNLLTNAAKYSHDGAEITVDARGEGGRAELTVRDLGIGIPEEMMPRLFDLFVQERQALDRARGGLGLGLAIVRGIVAAHEGSVRAHSDGPGRGSAFVVELPLATGAELEVSPPRAPAAVSPAPAPGPARILIVDDNRDAAVTLAQVLRGLGQEVEVVFDGEAALAAARTFRPALALLDIGLPGLDGYTLAGRLRAQQAPGRVRLVAVTGYGQAGDRERAFAAGFDAHVVKPLRVETIESMLEDLHAEGEAQPAV